QRHRRGLRAYRPSRSSPKGALSSRNSKIGRSFGSGSAELGPLPLPCDVVVHCGPNGYLAFNNACPHVRLPFYDRMPPKKEHAAKLPPRQSLVTDDLVIVCCWHGSCYDLQTG